MISSLSTVRGMASPALDAASQTHLRTNKSISLQEMATSVSLPENMANSSVQSTTDNGVSVDFSVSRDVFSAVNNFFNLGTSGRFDTFHSLSPGDKEQFVKIVAELAKSGYIGYEELIVNNKVERHDVTTEIGDQRLRRARVYDDSKDPAR